jgi:hypothetical protein
MKRILPFAELSPAMQNAGVAKIQRVAELTAGYRGEIWTESARTLAESARFTVIRDRDGEVSAIWDFKLAHPPTVMPGTEERRAA